MRKKMTVSYNKLSTAFIPPNGNLERSYLRSRSNQITKIWTKIDKYMYLIISFILITYVMWYRHAYQSANPVNVTKYINELKELSDNLEKESKRMETELRVDSKGFKRIVDDLQNRMDTISKQHTMDYEEIKKQQTGLMNKIQNTMGVDVIKSELSLMLKEKPRDIMKGELENLMKEVGLKGADEVSFIGLLKYISTEIKTQEKYIKDISKKMEMLLKREPIKFMNTDYLTDVAQIYKEMQELVKISSSIKLVNGYVKIDMKLYDKGANGYVYLDKLTEKDNTPFLPSVTPESNTIRLSLSTINLKLEGVYCEIDFMQDVNLSEIRINIVVVDETHIETKTVVYKSLLKNRTGDSSVERFFCNFDQNSIDIQGNFDLEIQFKADESLKEVKVNDLKLYGIATKGE